MRTSMALALVGLIFACGKSGGAAKGGSAGEKTSGGGMQVDTCLEVMAKMKECRATILEVARVSLTAEGVPAEEQAAMMAEFEAIAAADPDETCAEAASAAESQDARICLGGDCRKFADCLINTPSQEPVAAPR